MSILPRILLVDDNDSDRELAALVLSGEFDRVEIEKVRSATEFSAAMATGLFGLVITEAELEEGLRTIDGGLEITDRGVRS